MRESSSAAAGSRDEHTGDGLLGYHPLHDETGSQTAARRQDDARSRAQRRRQRQVQRGVTPSQASSQASQHPQIANARPSQSDQFAPDGGSTLDGDGVESEIFEDDGVFEGMPNTSGAAIPEQDWSFLEQFNRRFDENQPETCTVCNERWFDMNLKPNGQCGRCDKASRLNQINRLSAENYMDPGEFPAHLPKLDNTEEMLIARCHVHVQVQRFRGVQYKYAGHTVYFMQNTGKVYNKLPRLPRDLEVGRSF